MSHSSTETEKQREQLRQNLAESVSQLSKQLQVQNQTKRLTNLVFKSVKKIVLKKLNLPADLLDKKIFSNVKPWQRNLLLTVVVVALVLRKFLKQRN